MMPLMFANTGETNIIKKVGGSPEVKKHLENLGFVSGGEVTVISALGGMLLLMLKKHELQSAKRWLVKL